MVLVDSHTHLYLKEFDKDRDTVVKNAFNEGVRFLLLPNIDLDSLTGMGQMVRDYPGRCLPMIGLHPTSVKADFPSVLDRLYDQFPKENYIAIGETGIDLYWDKQYESQQTEAFRIQIQWAKDFRLPIVVHARESFRELFRVLDKEADENLKGVFHSFTGNLKDAEKLLEYGFFVGINGIITFKNSGLDKIVKEIPPERILLETDSPFLAPVPKRGRRNESAYIIYIASRLGEILGLSTEEVAEITTRNARELFKL